MRFLVVNADDFNLTGGTARAILDAHRNGIVSSTSVFTNLNFEHGECDKLRKTKSIGIGLHLNVTFGRPLAQPRLISSLVKSSGTFKNQSEFRKSKINPKHLFLEYELQLFNFRAIFGRNPDHLNTHHHLHEIPDVAIAVVQLASKYQIPVRRSNALTALHSKIKTSDYFFGSLSHHTHWTETSLLNILKNLPAGTSEIMCHPAYVNSELSRISSFSTERGKEFRLFSSPKLRKTLSDQGVILQTKF